MTPRRVLAAWIAVVACAGPAAAQATPPSRAQALDAARAVVQAARHATLVTVADGVEPQARIVDPFAPDADFTIWVATNPRTRKVAELRKSPRIALLYFNAAASEFVTVHGTATLVTDPDEKARHWKDEWAAFYDGGPRGDGYLLIKVTPSRLEIVSPARGFDTDPKTWRPFTVEMSAPR